MFRTIALIMMAVFGVAPAAAGPAALGPPEMFGRWVSHTMPGAGYAYTDTSSGASFGYTCQGSCSYYVHLRNRCEPGRRYDLALSSEGAQFKTSVICRIAEDWQYFVVDDPRVLGLIEGQNIAVSMLVGKKQSTPQTFPLEGAKEAIALARQRWMQSLAAGAQPPAHGLDLPPPPIVIVPPIR